MAKRRSLDLLPAKSVNPHVGFDQMGTRTGASIDQVGAWKERTVLAGDTTNNFNGEYNGANLGCTLTDGMGD